MEMDADLGDCGLNHLWTCTPLSEMLSNISNSSLTPAKCSLADLDIVMVALAFESGRCVSSSQLRLQIARDRPAQPMTALINKLWTNGNSREAVLCYDSARGGG